MSANTFIMSDPGTKYGETMSASRRVRSIRRSMPSTTVSSVCSSFSSGTSLAGWSANSNAGAQIRRSVSRSMAGGSSGGPMAWAPPLAAAAADSLAAWGAVVSRSARSSSGVISDCTG